jgi:hypothetical protein
MSGYYKSFKLLLVSSISLFLFHFIDGNNYLKSLQIKFDKSGMYSGFDFFIFTSVTKYFLLLLGIVAIIFLLLRTFKINNK